MISQSYPIISLYIPLKFPNIAKSSPVEVLLGSVPQIHGIAGDARRHGGGNDGQIPSHLIGHWILGTEIDRRSILVKLHDGHMANLWDLMDLNSW